MARRPTNTNIIKHPIDTTRIIEVFDNMQLIETADFKYNRDGEIAAIYYLRKTRYKGYKRIEEDIPDSNAGYIVLFNEKEYKSVCLSFRTYYKFTDKNGNRIYSNDRIADQYGNTFRIRKGISLCGENEKSLYIDSTYKAIGYSKDEIKSIVLKDTSQLMAYEVVVK